MIMNGYMVFGMVMMLLMAVVGYVVLTSPIPELMIIIMFSGFGVGISFAGFMVVNKVYKSIYKVVVRVYAERYDAFTIVEQTRCKVVKNKKGYEYLESVGGKRYKMPNRKYIMKGNDPYIDIFDTKIQQFPVTIKYKSGDKNETIELKNEADMLAFIKERPIILKRNNIEDVHKEIISENQRAWFADQCIPSVGESTKPPVSNIIQIATAMSIIGVVILFTVVVLMGPDFVAKMDSYWRSKYAELDTQQQAFYDKISTVPLQITCVEGKTDVVRPTPPPG